MAKADMPQKKERQSLLGKTYRDAKLRKKWQEYQINDGKIKDYEEWKEAGAPSAADEK